MTRPLDTDEMRTWRAFLRASTRVMRRLEADLGPHGLTLADYEILAVLSDAPERQLRMCDLAAESDVSASRLTYRVDGLQQRGLVQRRPCPTDGRVMYAALSDDGFAALEAAYPTHVAGVRSLVIDPIGDQAMRETGDALLRVVDALG